MVEEDPDEVPEDCYHKGGPLADDYIVAAEMVVVLAVAVVVVEVVVAAGSRMAWNVVVGPGEAAAGIEDPVALQVVPVAAAAVAMVEVIAAEAACEVVGWVAGDFGEEQIVPVAVVVHLSALEVEETVVEDPLLEWPPGLREHPL